MSTLKKMEEVHIFIASNQFSSEEDLDNYVHPEYNDNGERIESKFIEETQLENYEPMCIETAFEDKSLSLYSLCEGFSYWKEWIDKIPKNINVNSVVCVYTPNKILNYSKSKLKYHGSFRFEK